MNIILKMIWNEFFPSLTRFSFFIVIFLFFEVGNLQAQFISKSDFSSYNYSKPLYSIIQADSVSNEYPDPKAVLRQSMIVPGWGQITNKQAWKVPIVYGLLGGLSYYSVYLTKQYHDYRAAYYNSFDSNTDMRFGATPDYLQGQNSASLKNNRDFLRNRRDFVYVTVFLAYVLNVVDSYVFAHLRPFDVSDDLSANEQRFIPSTLTSPLIGETPSVSLKIRF